MNKLYYFILFCFAALCFTACSDDDLEFSGIEGKDHYISDFALNVGGITYQATIAGDKITVEIPYNTDLKGATPTHRPYRIGRMNGNSLLPPKCRKAKYFPIHTDMPTSSRAAAWFSPHKPKWIILPRPE